jgi:hypothetical protein
MAVVLMPKRRQTIPIAHADDVPTTSYDWLVWTYGGYTTSTTSIIAQMMQRPGWLLAPFLWQAIEHAYGRQLNTEVRQQITTVTTQYLKDCAFDRAVAPKAMARERIERIRRAAGDLEKVMRDSKPFSASTDELSREQQQNANSYADGLIRQHLDERRSRARDRLHHFRNVLKSLVIACDYALNDLSAAEYRDDKPWNWWIQGLTRIAGEQDLPAGVSTELDKEGRPLPFVRLVEKLESYLPADARPRKRSPAALAMAIARGRNT